MHDSCGGEDTQYLRDGLLAYQNIWHHTPQDNNLQNKDLYADESGKVETNIYTSLEMNPLGQWPLETLGK
jgi:hypothetical protein